MAFQVFCHDIADRNNTVASERSVMPSDGSPTIVGFPPKKARWKMKFSP